MARNNKFALFNTLAQGKRPSRGMIWGALIIAALLAFELFNYSTTDFAMNDLLGDLRFAGIRWSTILALAFCGIDFAGIARLFTPEQGEDEPVEVWYLFGAWLLAAAMNAMLTWWGISIAIANHTSLGNEVIARETLLKVVPIFVAIMVWVIRVLIIGTFSIAGERLFTQADQQAGTAKKRSYNNGKSYNTYKKPATRKVSNNNSNYRRPAQSSPMRASSTYRPAPKTRPKPTYHPVGSSNPQNGNGNRNNSTAQQRSFSGNNGNQRNNNSGYDYD